MRLKNREIIFSGILFPFFLDRKRKLRKRQIRINIVFCICVEEAKCSEHTVVFGFFDISAFASFFVGPEDYEKEKLMM